MTSVQILDSLGLCGYDLANLKESTGWSNAEALKNLEFILTGTVGACHSKEAIMAGLKNAGLFDKLSQNLSGLNTMRGGLRGFKGFVFEELHGTSAAVKGQRIEVCGDNGVADFLIRHKNGRKTLAQAKMVKDPSKIDFPKYMKDNQVLVTNKGNTAVINKAKKAGMKVVESDVTASETEGLSKLMQAESKITGKSNSVAIPKLQSAVNIAKEAHKVGLKTARTGAQFGGGFSLGANIVEVVSGDKEVGEAALDVAKDTAISAGVGYATGVVATAVGNTAVGAAISGAAGTVASGVASTAVGSAAVGAGSAALAAVGGVGTAAVTSTLAAGAAVGSTVSAAGAAIGTAVASTSVGGAAIAAGTAAGSALAGTAVGGAAIAAGSAATGAAVAAGTAVAAAAVAAAPIVAVGAAIGGVVCLGRKIFRGW